MFSFYSEALMDDADLAPVAFLEFVLESWEMLIEDWTLTDESAVNKELPNDPHTIRSSDDAVIRHG